MDFSLYVFIKEPGTRGSLRYWKDNFATRHILLVQRHSSALCPCLIFMVKSRRQRDVKRLWKAGLFRVPRGAGGV